MNSIKLSLIPFILSLLLLVSACGGSSSTSTLYPGSTTPTFSLPPRPDENKLTIISEKNDSHQEDQNIDDDTSKDLYSIIKNNSKFTLIENKSKNSSKANFNSIKLLTLQHKLWDQKIPLNPYSAYNDIQEAKKADYDYARLDTFLQRLEQIDVNRARNFRKLVKNIDLITYDYLLSSLKNMSKDLLKLISNKQYSVSVIHHKSQHWISSLVVPLLGKEIPSSAFRIQSTTIADGSSIVSVKKPDEISEDILISFDDASYSGTQLASTIKEIDSLVKIKKTLILFVPFMTKYAINIVKQAGQTSKNLNVVLLTTKHRLIEVKSVLAKADLMGLKLSGFSYYDAFNGVTLSHMEWKTPDGLSFLPQVLITKFTGEELRKFELSEVKPRFCDFSAEDVYCFQEYIHPPYKKEQRKKYDPSNITGGYTREN